MVLAWTTPDQSGLDMLRQLRDAVPGARIVVRSSRPGADAALVTLEAGVDAYVETTDLAALVAAVVRLAADDPSDSGIVAGLRAAVQGRRSAPPQETKPFRVLVVDDDPTARRLLRLSLELEGAEVTDAASLSEARDQIGHHFDGVVLDRRLPDGDGLDLLPVLAKRHPQASIVVCSNLEDHVDPWFVLHVPKTDIASVVSALGLVRRVHPSILGLALRDNPSTEARLSAPVSGIVGRWTARLGSQLANPPVSAAHALITQLVNALNGQEGGAEGDAVLLEAADPGRRAEVSVRQLVDLRELLTGELGRQLDGDDRAGPLATVNRELDTWILAVVARDVERLHQRASTDPLTGLLNRRAFDETLTQEVARAARNRRPFTVMMIDLDGLKAINDRDGHPAGDAALVAMAKAIRGALRVSDSAYRVGGDEFVILLPETPKRFVPGVIERVQGGGAPAFSWGAATYLEDTEEGEMVIDLADRQLLGRRHDRRA